MNLRRSVRYGIMAVSAMGVFIGILYSMMRHGENMKMNTEMGRLLAGRVDA